MSSFSSKFLNALTSTALNLQSCDLIYTNVTQVGLQFTAVILELGTCFCGLYPRRYTAAEKLGVKQEDVNRSHRAATLSYVKTMEGKQKLILGFSSQ